MSVVQFQNRGRTRHFHVISKLRSLKKKKVNKGSKSDRSIFKTENALVNLGYLQDSENPILACQNWDNTCEVFRGHTCDVIDLVAGQEVVLVLAVTVVVVDVTCTHEKVGT